MDEPTTGLHMSDIENLLRLFDLIVSRGNTLVVIEHNLDVMKQADWIIDIGPDGGKNGGQVVFTGTPVEMLRCAFAAAPAADAGVGDRRSFLCLTLRS